MIKAVTFDCWGTLLLDSPAADEGYRRERLAGMGAVLDQASVSVTSHHLAQAYTMAGRRLAELWRGHRDLPVLGHVRALLDAIDPALSARLSSAVLDALVDAYSSPAGRVPPAIDPGATEALDALSRRGCALGVVSNVMRTPGVVLRSVLEGPGLLESFAVLTFSDECGIRKPDPEIFLRTLRHIGVAPEQAVHVGDDPVLDVEGARDAGMRVIQVTASGRATGAVKPDAVVRGLGEVPAVLARLSS